MSDLRQKIIVKLDELIKEADQLRGDISSLEDSREDMWVMRVRKLMERIGGDKLAGDFNAAGAFPFNMRASEHERLQYLFRALEGRKNFLIVVKEDLEFFDEKDEPELKKIRHKFEAGVNLGVVKGKYTQERE